MREEGRIQGKEMLGESIYYKMEQRNSAFETRSGKIPEILAFILYGVMHFIISTFHEPWYDEAEAWQIARCASIKEILFQIPHYEGHPPLWHLILMPFAKLGANYEWSLCIVSFFFTGIMVALILWKSPFPRIVRLLLPFTYFFFYQYGVISRPYCMMMLAFILLAITYQKRNEKPGRFVLCLLFLCLTSAYGILFAGGISLVWVLEIWDKRKVTDFFKSFSKDTRIWWLLFLLLCAICLMLEIIPRNDAVAVDPLISEKISKGSGIGMRLWYMFVMLPADSIISNVFYKNTNLSLVSFRFYNIIGASIIGIVIWWLLIVYGRKKKTLLQLILPYSFFAIFSAVKYIWRHHIGVGLIFLIWWIWISIEEDSRQDDKKIGNNYWKKIAVFCCVLGLGVSLYWNIAACIQEIRYTYAAGREEAKFIKEHHLDEYRILTSWSQAEDEKKKLRVSDINMCMYATNLSPYFENNIFYHFNEGKDNKAYDTHQRASEEYTEKCMEELRKCDYPDVLLMNPDLNMIYEGDIDIPDYTLVYSKIVNMIWKNQAPRNQVRIYVREDLAKELGLEEVPMEYVFQVE